MRNEDDDNDDDDNNNNMDLQNSLFLSLTAHHLLAREFVYLSG